jgi:hypothetical protein
MPRRLRLIPFLLLILPLAAQDTTPFPTPPSIKGLQVQMEDDAIALGIHHAGVNINITGLVDLQKKPGNPKRTVDGYEFSFNESYLRSLDSQIKPLSDKGILVYLIVIAYPSKNATVDSLVVHPRDLGTLPQSRHTRMGRRRRADPARHRLEILGRA